MYDNVADPSMNKTALPSKLTLDVLKLRVNVVRTLLELDDSASAEPLSESGQQKINSSNTKTEEML